MSKFELIKKEKILTANIRGQDYEVIQSGQGIPCLLICLGTPSFRTLSTDFAEQFEIYSSDVYWEKTNPSLTIQSMEDIIDDIKALGDALHLKNYIIFAHSAYGIIALEFAKKYPSIARGIIMVGTPVNSNEDVLKQNNLIFETEADELRKKIDRERRAKIATENFDQYTAQERWLREYIYRDAPRYWHIPDFDCTELWNNVQLSDLFIILFNEILPATNVLKNLELINTPVLLAAGVSDYDCCPWKWSEVASLPKHFTIEIFHQSGHWPHYEESTLFNKKVSAWIESL